jgi:hypothetical protein
VAMNLLSTFVFFSVLTAELHGQTITGTVWDTTSNSRVAAARVILLQVDSSQSVVTDSSGRFHFRVMPGMASLRINALGYSDLSSPPFMVEKTDHYSLLIYMSTTPIEVMPIHVIARSRRAPTNFELFEQRRRSSGSGYFLDEKALARIYATDATDFLRRIPGVIMERDYVRLRSYCGEPVFIVDGMEFRPPERNAPSATEMTNSFVNPNDVVAIEVYKDAPPPELQSGLSADWPCGVVVIWTKRR